MYLSPINYQPQVRVNNNVNFQSNVSAAKKAADVISKSGEYQVYVDKLEKLQREIQYGCYLLRQIPHNWSNPESASVADRDNCVRYHANVDNLIQEKKKIIAEMVDPLLKKEKYKDLPDGYRERIIDSEEAGSTWAGYYFNEEKLDEKIENMKIRDKKWAEEAPIRELEEKYRDKAYDAQHKLYDLYNREADKCHDNLPNAIPTQEDWFDFLEEWNELERATRDWNNTTVEGRAEIDKNLAKVEQLISKYN